MSLTVYAEARGESYAGKIAVGSVILERVDHRKWDGQTIQEVCLWPAQFSCYLKSDPNFKMLLDISHNWDREASLNKILAQCWTLSTGMIDGSIPRDPELAAAHCCQYLTTAAKRGCDWWKDMKLVKKVGHHEFYA